MTRQPGNDRSILCRYYPTEVGVYQVYVLWSGEHVTGSPFHVYIVDTLQELHNLNLALQEEVHLPIAYDTGTINSNRVLLFNDDFWKGLELLLESFFEIISSAIFI